MRIQSNQNDQNDQSAQNNQSNQSNQSNTQYLQHVQSFNEGYSKACFDIGFSQGYNSGYHAGLNQGYWNSQIQTTDECVGTEFTSLPQTEQNDQGEQYEQCDQFDQGEQCDQYDQGEQSEIRNSMENVFDDNMEIDFEWYSQDNENETQYTPLYDTSTIWNVVKTEVDEEDGSRQDVDVNNIFNSHEPISWNVIKEEPKLEDNYPFLFENKYTEDPFGDYKLDSQIFSSFSWGDILTHNIDVFENTDTPFNECKYEQTPSEDTNPTPITIQSLSDVPPTPPTPPILDHYSTFPAIQEDSDNQGEYNEEDTEEIQENEKDNNNSWVYIAKTEEKANDSTDIDSYSFNFDSFTSDDAQTKTQTEHTYTSKTCDEISLDSSISSESIAEDDMNVVSFSMPSLPYLQISFDDRNELTYYDEIYCNPYDEIYCNPASQLPNSCPPQSPIQRATKK